MGKSCSERAIYSPEPVAACSPTSFSGMTQLSLLSGMDMPAKSCESGQQKDGSPICECGKEMSECSIHPNTPEKWIASMQDSLARICQSLENNPVLAKAHAAASIGKSSELLALFDHDSCSLKMSQQSFLEDSNTSWPTWPRSGMTVDGRAYELPNVVPSITGTDGGYGQHWQTPVADDAANRKSGKYNGRGEPKLSAQVKLFPAPRANDAEKRGQIANDPRNGLPAPAMHWPTPTASASKGSSPASLKRKNGRSRVKDRIDHAVMASDGGQLNPTWVCWLMGWPMVWFDGVERKK